MDLPLRENNHEQIILVNVTHIFYIHHKSLPFFFTKDGSIALNLTVWSKLLKPSASDELDLSPRPFLAGRGTSSTNASAKATKPRGQHGARPQGHLFVVEGEGDGVTLLLLHVVRVDFRRHHHQVGVSPEVVLAEDKVGQRWWQAPRLADTHLGHRQDTY